MQRMALIVAIDTVVLGVLVLVVVLLFTRLVQLMVRCDRMEHDIRVSMAGKILPIRDDVIARAPAAGMEPTPPPQTTAYQDYLSKRGTP